MESSNSSSGLHVLAIDIGGTGLKAALLDLEGNMLTDRVRVKTPHPCSKETLLDTLIALVQPLGKFDRVSVGFPGVTRRGLIYTAPNLGTDELKGFDLGGELSKRLGCPVRVVNDADMQGQAVVRGHGVEVVITLGTGMGFAIFSEGELGPHMELSHHVFQKGEDYDQRIGNAAFEKIGVKKWNRRVEKAIQNIRVLTSFDHLYIGGGNAKEITFALQSDIEIVNNQNGLKGGAWLWRKDAPAAAAVTADASTTP
jgi:polyphosphate glucokinase